MTPSQRNRAPVTAIASLGDPTRVGIPRRHDEDVADFAKDDVVFENRLAVTVDVVDESRYAYPRNQLPEFPGIVQGARLGTSLVMATAHTTTNHPMADTVNRTGACEMLKSAH